MKNFLNIKGNLVYDLHGKEIGIINDAVINFKSKRIYAYLVKSKSYFSNYFLLKINRVEYYERGEIICKSKNKVGNRFLKTIKPLLTNKLIGIDITNKEGIIEGYLADIIYDEKNGEIFGVSCSSGPFEDFVLGRKIFLDNNNISFKNHKVVIEASSIEIRNVISLKKHLLKN